MQNDIRASVEYGAVKDFYSALFAPGQDHVHAALDLAPASDGKRAYFTGALFRGELEEGPSTGVYEIDLTTGVHAPVRSGPARMVRPSPDGSRLALLAGAPEEELLILPVGGAEAVAAPPVDGLIEMAQWSPHGRRLLLLVAGRGADLAGYQGGYALRSEAKGPSWLPTVSTGEEEDLWRRLWLLDADSLKLRRLSPDGLNVWEASWLGSDAVAAVCSDHHGEGSWYGARLSVLDLDGSEVRDLYRPVDQIGLPVGSPNGECVAFVEAVCSDRGIVCGVLKVVGADGVVQAPDTDGVEITSLVWRDNDSLHVAGHRAFETVVADVDIRSGKFSTLWASEEATCGQWYPSAQPLPGNRSLFAAEAYDRAPFVAVADGGKIKEVASFASAETKAAMAACGAIEPVRWLAPDGLEIHGWLARPAKLEGPAPLVLEIHGGPVWAHRNRWMARLRATALLVARGAVVLHPNPRGSSTRGQDFARLVKGDMGGADTGDFLSAISHLADAGLVDRTRVACTGASYGGFMSAWLVTQSNTFAAAAPISPVSNWFSQHRTSQIPFFDEMFLEDSASSGAGKFFDRSPVMFADRVTTPCLVIGGALDKNTPPGQAVEFHQSLLEHGIESALVMYPEDGHSLRGYPAYIDTAARILMWFGEHLGLAMPA
jgi:dipeptidyl aminopeptidase/acylaminoacyl peptidase